MSSYLLKIKLLSDLCVSDGGVYNSSLDTDICHDEYGFPFIPAKRIKGCLRECAQELIEWGMCLPVERLFGKEDRYGSAAAVRIGNARLEGYEEKLEYVKSVSDNLVFHPQNVLDHFSYIRFQTSLDQKSGTADPTSLRTMRVANKGLVFEAQIEMDEKYWKDMKICCDALTNMGVARTRGLGEVCASLIPDQKKRESNGSIDYLPGAVRLDYEIYLEEPVICKSVNGGETRTQDYIEGGKILGLIAQELRDRQRSFEEFMAEGELFCSNAYPAWEEKRCTEVPAVIYSVKDEDHCYVNQLYPLPEEIKQKQMSRMKHCYVTSDESGKLRKTEVCIEERYHHRRPEDKSIGRAAREKRNAEEGAEGSQFYQMSSIEAGQAFKGFVTGTEGQIRQIYDCITNRNTFYLGYSRSAEYGKTRILITAMSGRKEEKTVTSDEWVLKLEAPTIVYNDRAFYSTAIEDLDTEIRTALNLPEDVQAVVKPFICYTSVGGYNVTWGARKPIIEAFDKGTVFYYRFDRPIELRIPETILLGERVSEGFGEASLWAVNTADVRSAVGCVESFEKGTCEESIAIGDSKFARSICDELFEDYVRTAAIMAVKELPGKEERNGPDKDVLASLKTQNARPMISNLLLMCRQSDSFDKIRHMEEERYGKKSEKKQDKLKKAGVILQQVEKNSLELQERFCKNYRISDYVYDPDKCKRLYLTAYLQQLRYMIRKAEKHSLKGE